MQEDFHYYATYCAAYFHQKITYCASDIQYRTYLFCYSQDLRRIPENIVYSYRVNNGFKRGLMKCQ